MRETRQRYYAALEHENAAQRLFDGQGGSGSGGNATGSGVTMGETPAGIMGVPAPHDVYSELGMQVYRALEGLLGSLSGWARSGGGDGGRTRRAVVDVIQPLSRDLEALRHHLERQDMVLNEIAAGIRRIDRFTLDAFQRLRGRGDFGEMATIPSPSQGASQTSPGLMHSSGEQGIYHRPSEREVRSASDELAMAAPKRLAKEETVARALEAARRLRAQGRKLTLKSVAEAAGLKYSQIVYAFGSKEEMLHRVTRQDVDVPNAS